MKMESTKIASIKSYLLLGILVGTAGNLYDLLTNNSFDYVKGLSIFALTIVISILLGLTISKGKE